MCWIVQCVERSRSSPSGRLLTTVRVGVHQADARSLRGRALRAGKASACSFSVVIGLLLSCVMVDALYCMDLGITAHRRSHVFMRCIKKRAWRATAHAENLVIDLDDEIRAWFRQKGEKSKLQKKLTLARLRSSSGHPELKAKGAATRHMASFTRNWLLGTVLVPATVGVLGVVADAR